MQIEVVEMPEHGTDAMVTLLHRVLNSLVGQLANDIKFTTGDVMSAALHLIIDAGLMNASPANLRKDIATSVDRILAEVAKKREAMN